MKGCATTRLTSEKIYACWFFIAAVLLFLCVACSTDKPYQIDLMPAPHVYADGTVDPFDGIDDILNEQVPYRGILYATDRKPSKKKGEFYRNERGFLLRLGVAEGLIVIPAVYLLWQRRSLRS